MTREAMFTFGLNCIYLADSEMYLDNRTDPIGEFETVSMGCLLYTSHKSEHLWIFGDDFVTRFSVNEAVVNNVNVFLETFL